jgi:hypothetical protein
MYTTPTPGSDDVQTAVMMKNNWLGYPTSSTLIPRTVQCAATGRIKEAEGKLSSPATPAQENLAYILWSDLKSISQRRNIGRKGLKTKYREFRSAVLQDVSVTFFYSVCCFI